LISGDVTLSEEHVDYAWVDFDEVNNYNMIPSIVEQIKRWNKGI
jgi:hypothetical protein